jgi:hypothetical protein
MHRSWMLTLMDSPSENQQREHWTIIATYDGLGQDEL